MCYCQNIQPTSAKAYAKLIQVGVGLNTFCPGHKIMIEAFVGSKPLVIRKKTSFGKSLIHVMPDLMKQRTLFVVVSPNMSSIEDQVLKMNYHFNFFGYDV